MAAPEDQFLPPQRLQHTFRSRDFLEIVSRGAVHRRKTWSIFSRGSLATKRQFRTPESLQLRWRAERTVRAQEFVATAAARLEAVPPRCAGIQSLER